MTEIKARFVHQDYMSLIPQKAWSAAHRALEVKIIQGTVAMLSVIRTHESIIFGEGQQ